MRDEAVECREVAAHLPFSSGTAFAGGMRRRRRDIHLSFSQRRFVRGRMFGRASGGVKRIRTH
jgi:hypothetical protein